MAFNLGDATVTFRGDIRPLQKATGDAKKLLDGLATHARKALSAGDPFGMMKRGALNANKAIAGVNTRLVVMRTRLVLATKAANALAKALAAVNGAGGGPTGRGVGAAARGIGEGIAAVLKGLGQGVGTIVEKAGKGVKAVLQGFGQGTGAIIGRTINALGSASRNVASGFGLAMKRTLDGTARLIKSFGSMFNNVAKGFGTALRAAVNSVKSVIKTVTAPLRGLTGGLGSFGGGLGGGMGLVTGALGALSVGVAGALSVDFLKDVTIETEKSLNVIRRSMETTDAEFEKFSQELRELAAMTSSVKFEDILDIGAMAAKMGIAGEEITLFTSDVVKMHQVMTDIPVEELTSRLAGLLTVFRKGTEDTLAMASAVNRLDLMSTASAREILDVANRMSGTAAFLGMSPQQTLGIAATLRQAKVPVETAGTAMAQILGRMQTRKDRAEFAKVAGVPTDQFQKLSAKDPLLALKSVAVGLKGMKPQEALEALERLKLDGQRARQVLLALAQSMGTLDKFVKASEKDWDDQSSILQAVARNAGIADGMIEKLWNNVKLAAEALGKLLLPVLKGVVSGLTDLFNDIRSYLDSNKDAISSWAKSVGEKLSLVGVIFREWKLLFGGIGNIFSKDMRSFGVVAIFIREKWSQLVKIFSNVAGALPKTLGQMGKNAMIVFGNFAMAVGDFLADLFRQIGQNIGIDLMIGLQEQLNSNPALTGAVKAGMKLLGKDTAVLDQFQAAKLERKPLQLKGDAFKDVFANQEKVDNPFAPALDNLPNQNIRMKERMNRLKEARQKQIDKNQEAAGAQEERENAARDALRGQHNPFPVMAAGRLPAGKEARRRALRKMEAQDRKTEIVRAMEAIEDSMPELKGRERKDALEKLAKLRKVGKVTAMDRAMAGARDNMLGGNRGEGGDQDMKKNNEILEQIRDVLKDNKGAPQAARWGK